MSEESHRLCMEHLEIANRVRSDRARDKRAIRAGTKGVQSIISASPPEWSTATVLELLMAVHRVGEVRAAKLCRRAAVNPLLTLAELTKRQRNVLCAVVVEMLGEGA